MKSKKPRLFIQGGAIKNIYNAGFLIGSQDHIDTPLCDAFSEIIGLSSGAALGYMLQTGKLEILTNEMLKVEVSHFLNWSKLPHSPVDRQAMLKLTKKIVKSSYFRDDGTSLMVGVVRIDGVREYIEATKQNITDLIFSTMSLPGVMGPFPLGPPKQAWKSLRRFPKNTHHLAWDGGMAGNTPDINDLKQDQRMIILNTRPTYEPSTLTKVIGKIISLAEPHLGKALINGESNYKKNMQFAQKSDHVLVLKPDVYLGGMFAKQDTMKRNFQAGLKAGKGDKGKRFIEALVL